MNVAYTFILEMHKKKIAPSGNNIDWCLCGNNIHNIMASDSLNTGARRNGVLFALVGLFCSLANSLIASANGCGRPDSIGLFGPLRN
jgi:Na+/melibiose symporter-like transporter